MEVALGLAVIASLDKSVKGLRFLVARKFLARCSLSQDKVGEAFDGVALVAADIVHFPRFEMVRESAKGRDLVIIVG